MMFWSFIYILLALCNFIMAYVLMNIGKKLSKEGNIGVAGALIAAIANIISGLTVMSLFFHAMFFGT